jgi:hypothetical protein
MNLELIKGFIMGLFAPIIGGIVFWFVMLYPKSDLINFIQKVYEGGAFSQYVTLATLTNLIVFSIFMYQNRINAVRGIIFSTLIWVFLAIYFKIKSGVWD